MTENPSSVSYMPMALDGLQASCPNCASAAMVTFYEVPDVPVHSVLKIRTRDEALRFPTGCISLAYCRKCGFVSNTAFDPELLNYSAEYEETQGFSSTFNTFHRRLAADLIDRYSLHGKQIIEIGCGKGDFLNMICELGGNRGIGFDPAYIPERDSGEAKGLTTFVQDFYSEQYADHKGDFVCCKMTLEHIPQTAEFLGTVRRSIGNAPDTIVFFQIPETNRILQTLAFWDVYYEHCSYFTPESLDYLFRAQGFEVLNLWTDYDDQYLMIEARPGKSAPSLPGQEDLQHISNDVALYASRIQDRLNAWRSLLQELNQHGKRVVLWGGGSKAVAFLTTLGITDQVSYAVDINPYKHGTFLAKSGHEIVGPDFLSEYKPDVVIVMNPVYREEIRLRLAQMNLSPELLMVDAALSNGESSTSFPAVPA